MQADFSVQTGIFFSEEEDDDQIPIFAIQSQNLGPLAKTVFMFIETCNAFVNSI